MFIQERKNKPNMLYSPAANSVYVIMIVKTLSKLTKTPNNYAVRSGVHVRSHTWQGCKSLLNSNLQ